MQPPRESGRPGAAPTICSTSNAGKVADILADAFAEDPCMNWVVPHTALYPAFYRHLVSGLYLQHQLVFTDSQARSAALWLPPGASHQLPGGINQLGLVLRLLWHSGTQVLPRIRQVEEVMTRRHPQDPHYYLHAIGARRDCQGQGLGSALLKHGTRRCDDEGMPAYLESSSPRNVPLYERHGFEVQATEPIGAGGPPMFFMWREPRQ